MAVNEVQQNVARFEALVRLLNWENGMFVGFVAVGFAVAATRAGSSALAISRWSIVVLTLATGAALLTKTQYRLKSHPQTGELGLKFQKEMLRQANVRRHAPLYVAPLICGLLINAWVGRSIFSVGLAVVIGGAQWVNIFLSRLWQRQAEAMEPDASLAGAADTPIR
ncbi:MAG: hypothetical protein ABIS18_00475 [Actinomycetota bacterium]